MSRQTSAGAAACIDIVNELVGDTIQRTFTITDVAGNPRDLTNDAVRMEIAFPTPLILTEGSGITITDAVNGVGTFIITDEQTGAESAGLFAYGLKVEDSSGNERTAIYGDLELIAQKAE